MPAHASKLGSAVVALLGGAKAPMTARALQEALAARGAARNLSHVTRVLAVLVAEGAVQRVRPSRYARVRPPDRPRPTRPAPPADDGQPLGAFPRADGAQLRVSLRTSGRDASVSVRLWSRDARGVWRPVAGQAIDLALAEVPRVASALSNAFAAAHRRADAAAPIDS